MVKFLEKFMDKFLDFFNFGRFITIIIPGLITALCFTMLASQLIFPIGKELEQGPVPKVQSKETATEKKIESKKDSSRVREETTTLQKETTTTYEGSKDQRARDQEAIKKESKEALFKRQLARDYARVSSNLFNFFLVLLLTIVLGLMLYEIGYKVILSFPDEGEEQKLYRYDPQYDADDKVTKKFGFSKDPIGMVYFAPFLKEKFSGDENYYTFLVTDYYRFLEFSVNMPISIIVSAIIGVAYYALFSIRNSCWLYYRGFGVFFLMLFAGSIGFLLFVSPRIYRSYKKASKDLVQGVSDFMSKGLVKIN